METPATFSTCASHVAWDCGGGTLTCHGDTCVRSGGVCRWVIHTRCDTRDLCAEVQVVVSVSKPYLTFADQFSPTSWLSCCIFLLSPCSGYIFTVFVFSVSKILASGTASLHLRADKIFTANDCGYLVVTPRWFLSELCFLASHKTNGCDQPTDRILSFGVRKDVAKEVSHKQKTFKMG